MAYIEAERKIEADSTDAKLRDLIAHLQDAHETFNILEPRIDGVERLALANARDTWQHVLDQLRSLRTQCVETQIQRGKYTDFWEARLAAVNIGKPA